MIVMLDASTLRLAVIAVEVLLSLSLIGWMRSSEKGEPLPAKVILSILALGSVTALASAIVVIRYQFDIPTIQVQNPEVFAKYGTLMVMLNIFAAAASEEMAKYVVAAFLLLGKLRNPPRLSDTISTMILLGLGFALIEDAVYLFLQPDTVPAYRLLSFLVHSGTSAIVGYSLGRFRFGLTGYRELLRAILAGILLHTSYNLTTRLENAQLAFALTVLLTVLISLQIFILYRKTVKEQRMIEAKQRANLRKKLVTVKLLNIDPA
jgi:RsiW-degrading membrane proteinase PrsW (M82 family)